MNDKALILEALHEAESEVETRLNELSDLVEGVPNMLTRNAEGTLRKIRAAINLLERNVPRRTIFPCEAPFLTGGKDQ